MDDSKPPQPAYPPPLSSTPLSSSPSSSPIPPPTRFQLPFPTVLERAFAPLDDRVISFCQSRTDGFIHFFSMALTFFTAIEVSLVAPPTLYALGYDAAAGLCSSVLLVLGVVSQVPKKFIYRPRPWMVGRALPIRQDMTSSFPSRAVVCSVVFSWLFAWSLQLEGLLTTPLPAFVLWLCVLCIGALAAFARINVGAHYPSDTALGFVLGCLVVNLGTRLEAWWRTTCPLQSLPATSEQVVLSGWWQVIRWTSYEKLIIFTLASYAMTLLSITGFWVKCSYVYGLLLSSAAFRATYVCAQQVAPVSQLGHFPPLVSNPSFREHVHATATFVILLIFGMLTQRRKGLFRVLTFSFIYFGTLIAILSWRLRPGGYQ